MDIYMLMISNSAEYSSFSKHESLKVPLMICSSQTVRLVNHCFTTCTSCGLVLYIHPLVSLMISTLPSVRLVNHSFTASMTRANQTGHAKRNMPLYGSYQFVYIGQPSRRWKNKVALNVFFAKTNSWHPCPLKN